MLMPARNLAGPVPAVPVRVNAPLTVLRLCAEPSLKMLMPAAWLVASLFTPPIPLMLMVPLN